ncbi:hypothetical protein CP157_00300 [Paracoccus marcusii]|nr:hypothetical protein CP157_00300 [Paracoccus marcusii]
MTTRVPCPTSNATPTSPCRSRGAPPLFVAVEGEAGIIRDKATFADHWTSDLERWFPDGIDTPGMALIKVAAVRIHYWDGEEEGEVAPRA